MYKLCNLRDQQVMWAIPDNAPVKVASHETPCTDPAQLILELG
jgi:hypothetical protein